MIILGIESSCDETAVAIINHDYKILSHTLYSQIKEHSAFGGVIPELASRNHLLHMNNIILNALKKANLTLKDISAFAATAGPGLSGGLLIGNMYAKTFALIHSKPYIAVNHLQAHALVAKLENLSLSFPYLLLLISGGHSQFIAVLDVNKYDILGETIDDALGECFDKVARVLGFSYPGGAKIEQSALSGNDKTYVFPKPLFYSKNCNLSFSGLKTAVNNCVNTISKNNNNLPLNVVQDIAASFQKTIASILVAKFHKAYDIFLEKYNVIPQAFVLSGGVASNAFLQSHIFTACQKINLPFFVPSKHLCTDNGIMIAYTGLLLFKQGIHHDLSFKINPRWSLQDVTQV